MKFMGWLMKTKRFKKLTIKKIISEIDKRVAVINGCYALNQFASSGQLELLKNWILERHGSTEKNSITKRRRTNKKIIKRKSSNISGIDFGSVPLSLPYSMDMGFRQDEKNS